VGVSIMAKAARRQRSVPPTIGDILDGAYPGRVEDRPLLQTFGWWDRTVPQRIAKNARPVALRRGVLVVHTRTTAWAQELSFHEVDLLASVSARVPSIKRLRIQVGPMPPPPKPPAPPPPKVTPIEIGRIPGEIARELARVGDDALRETLTRAVCTSLAPRVKRASRKP
jgi:hypothetical protein